MIKIKENLFMKDIDSRIRNPDISEKCARLLWERFCMDLKVLRCGVAHLHSTFKNHAWKLMFSPNLLCMIFFFCIQEFLVIHDY